MSAHFITLTYDTKNVPITKSGYMQLSKRDVQLFMKKLRKANPEKLKYFICGEYGGNTMRPHYHALLFNVDIKTIQNAWANGSIHYGQVSDASIMYTLKYMCKPSKIPLHKNDDRQPEFRLMSKQIGINYLSKAMIGWHLDDVENRLYVQNDDYKMPMPRYYRERIYSKPQLIVAQTAATVRAAASDEKKSIESFNNGVDILKAKRDTVIAARNKMLRESKKRDKL